MRKLITIVAGVTLALLAACGSDDKDGGSGSGGGPGAAGDKDPCTLLTDDQVKKALGAAPKSHTLNQQAKPIVSCKWVTDDPEVSLDLSIGPANGYTPPSLDDRKTWEPVDGVGDKAAFSSAGPIFFVVGGGYGVQLLPGPVLTDEEKKDSDARDEKNKQAGISAAKDVMAALGAGPKDDSKPKATTKPTSTRPTSKPNDSDTTETTPEDTTESSDTDTKDPEVPPDLCSDPSAPWCPGATPPSP